MLAERLLSLLALAAACVAAGAVTAAALRSVLLAKRLHSLSDQFSRLLEEEVRPALVEVAQAARGLQQTTGKIDAAVVPLEHSLRRLERWTGATAEALLVSAVSPAFGKVTGALGGLRRGLGEIIRHGRGPNGRSA